ncbi:TIGR03086 family metal-binding protein [Glycomyces tenuis]|uniref:TIGR03086 family metal-binding protein n=1 Tax=Glycomyces tenuis TaxID=58116 RepID=UPI0004210988|nr:TIGR03086 family metal-binding protein [Glycomyces tenuis]
MAEIVLDFKPVTERMAALLDGVDDGMLSKPTPCEEYTVGALLNHALGLSWAFTSAARKERGAHTDNPPAAPSPEVDPEWRTLLPRRLDALAEAWSRPGAWEGETTVGGVTMPGDVTGLVGLNEVAVHGWDLARATGQEYELDPEIIGALTALHGQGADDQAARDGIYGPAVEVAHDASPLDRLIAVTGRDPQWRP